MKLKKVEKTICDVTGEELLPMLYELEQSIYAFAQKANMKDVFTAEGATNEEKGLKIFDNLTKKMLKEYPKDTLEIIGRMCMIEPENIGQYSAMEILSYLPVLFANKDIKRFFLSLLEIMKKA